MSILARLFVATVLLFVFVASATFYRAYAPYTDDYSWILHCDYRFAHPGEWFTQGSTDYHMGGRVVEVPVRWNHSPATKVHYVRDSLHMTLDLVALRWRALTGQYEKAVGSKLIPTPKVLAERGRI